MNSSSLVLMTFLLYYRDNPQPAIVEFFPITLEECRTFGESIQFIRKLYKADGMDLMCTLTGKEI